MLQQVLSINKNNFISILQSIRQNYMSSKKILACIAFVFLIFLQISGLTIKSHFAVKQAGDYHTMAHTMRESFLQFSFRHLGRYEDKNRDDDKYEDSGDYNEGDAEYGDDSEYGDDAEYGDDSGEQYSDPLIDFIRSDPELAKSLKSKKPFSKSGANKIRKFLSSNDEFKSMMLQSLEYGQGAECFKGLTKNQKNKIYKIMVDKMPVETMFTIESEENYQENDPVTEALYADRELGPILTKCDQKYGKQK